MKKLIIVCLIVSENDQICVFMKSQVGASIISAVLQEIFYARGADVLMHYQDNIGGNTDFLNMQDPSRITSKKISKENVLNSKICFRLHIKCYK